MVTIISNNNKKEKFIPKACIIKMTLTGRKPYRIKNIQSLTCAICANVNIL
jgi:hypothetical protein